MRQKSVQIVIAAAALASSCVAAFALDQGLCASGETSVFYCPSGGKTASLCASKSGDVRRLRYVFGTSRKIEFTYPSGSVAAPEAFRTGSIAYSGVGGEVVAFQNGAFNYALFYVLGAGVNFRGIVIASEGKAVRNLICSRHSDDELTTSFFNDMKLPEINPDGGPFEVPEVFWRR